MQAHSTAREHSETGDDYHGHPSYVRVWAMLVGFLVLSLLAGVLGHKILEVALIFTLAVVKTGLVVGNFMHLKWEPKLLWGFSAFAVLCLVFLYFGIAPDIVYVRASLAK